MDCDPETVEAFFDDLSQKSQAEIHTLLKNLKHIGYSDDFIERMSHEYYRYFQNLNADKAIACKPKIKRSDTKDLKENEKSKPSSYAVWITEPIQKELSPSSEPLPES